MADVDPLRIDADEVVSVYRFKSFISNNALFYTSVAWSVFFTFWVGWGIAAMISTNSVVHKLWVDALVYVIVGFLAFASTFISMWFFGQTESARVLAFRIRFSIYMGPIICVIVYVLNIAFMYAWLVKYAGSMENNFKDTVVNPDAPIIDCFRVQTYYQVRQFTVGTSLLAWLYLLGSMFAHHYPEHMVSAEAASARPKSH